MTLDDLPLPLQDLYLRIMAQPDRAAAIALGVLALLLLVLWLRARAAARAARSEAAALAPLPAELARTREALIAREAEAAQVPDLREEADQLRDALMEARTEIAGLRAEMQGRERSHAEKMEELRGMKKEIEDRFQALASGVLKTNSETFLGLVTERFEKHSDSAKADLEARQKAIKTLVEPLDQKLSKFDLRIGEIEKARNEAYGAIQQQVLQLAEGQKTLGQETRKLVQALRAPKTRGRWGEMQLKQVFEMAGMAEHVDFVTEREIEVQGARRRPDAIVRIPGGKTIVVDAKTPLEGYLDAIEADTPDQQAVHLKRHAQHVREHVKILASKSYQDGLQTTPDFVVMFIPGETFVAAAAETDPGLIEYAFENRVLIATPTTLMALVKAIAYGWQQEKMAENAVEVQRLARELYDRLSSFAGHLDKVGRGLKSSVNAYNSALGSLETRILPTARKFEQLGVVQPKEPLQAPGGMEEETRQLTAPEFTATTSG